MIKWAQIKKELTVLQAHLELSFRQPGDSKTRSAVKRKRLFGCFSVCITGFTRKKFFVFNLLNGLGVFHSNFRPGLSVRKKTMSSDESL